MSKKQSYTCHTCGKQIITQMEGHGEFPMKLEHCTQLECEGTPFNDFHLIPDHVHAYYELFRPKEVTEHLLTSLYINELGFTPAQRISLSENLSYIIALVRNHVARGGYLLRLNQFQEV